MCSAWLSESLALRTLCAPALSNSMQPTGTLTVRVPPYFNLYFLTIHPEPRPRNQELRAVRPSSRGSCPRREGQKDVKDGASVVRRLGCPGSPVALFPGSQGQRIWRRDQEHLVVSLKMPNLSSPNPLPRRPGLEEVS